VGEAAGQDPLPPSFAPDRSGARRRPAQL